MGSSQGYSRLQEYVTFDSFPTVAAQSKVIENKSLKSNSVV